MFKCNSCGYESNKYFGLCPKCHDGTGKEIKNININKNVNNEFKLANNVGNVTILKVNKNLEEDKASKVTKYEDFNAILSTAKGFIEGQVILLGASPGIGKSTLCSAIADEDTLYISSEENYKQVNNRFLRINPDSGCEIFNSTSFDEIIQAIKQTESKLIIIDSLNSINFGVGYLTVARYCDEITKLIKSLNKICIIISQVAKNGEISGMNSIPHIVDTVMYLESSEISSTIIATTSKNRYGEVGGVALFKHQQNGFIEIKEDIYDNNLPIIIGETKTETRFGHKKMKISIDSLVAIAQGSFGLRKSNGYNQNRLIQIIGILSYYGKINFIDRDIYINISNGLYTDDITVELAIANSILSSYFHKGIIKEAKGELRLNGNLIDAYIDGQKINHISELIDIYNNYKKE